MYNVLEDKMILINWEAVYVVNVINTITIPVLYVDTYTVKPV